MTVRRMTEAETAPRITNREGDTEERRTDLVGSESSARAESGSAMGNNIVRVLPTFDFCPFKRQIRGKHLKKARFDVQFRV